MASGFLGPAEMARRLGVSAKALRVYERLGLVRPVRSQAGWRCYGPAQVARLHGVLALRALGLPLARVAALLDGELAGLDAVLALQERVLQARLGEAARMLALLGAARAKLAQEGALSADDLIILTKETAMDETTNAQAWQAALEPLIDRHYTPAERAALGERKVAAYAAAGYDERGFSAAWDEMFAEARALQAEGDTQSARACALVRRWREMVGHFTAGDAATAGKVQAVWGEAMGDPAVAGRLPLRAEEFAFVQSIADGMRARGE